VQFIFVSKVVPQHVVETGQLLCSILQIQFVFLCNSWFSQCAINVAVVVALTETEYDCWQFFFTGVFCGLVTHIMVHLGHGTQLARLSSHKLFR